MTRVLVTGASGLLGANLVLEWLEDHEVIGVSHSSRLVHPRLEARQLDLAEPGTASRLFREVRPRVVVHCAAATDVEACERDPAQAHRLNVEMAQAVARAAAEVGARLLHISTDGVFDGEGGPYTEDDEASPVNVYGRSKLAGETAVREAYPGALVIRTTFFGWNGKRKLNLAEWFLDRIRSGREAPGYTDITWSPLVVQDLADLLDLLSRADVAGVLHLPGQDCLSKYEFGRRLARTFGLPVDRVVPSQAAFHTPRPRRTCLDGTKARGLLRRDLPTVDVGLRHMESFERMGSLDHLRTLVAG
jgi:dTDP-4-dehydrorhamnose reductase